MRPDFIVFVRIVQEIHNLHQTVLGLVLSCDIRESCLNVILGIDFRATLSELHEVAHPGAAFSHAADPLDGGTEHPVHQHAGKNPPEDEIQEGRPFLVKFFHEADLAAFAGTFRRGEPAHEIRVGDRSGDVGGVSLTFQSFLIGQGSVLGVHNLVSVDHDIVDASAVHVRDE